MSELKLPEINRVLLSGRLTRDPDRRYAADGTAVTSFTLAFNRHYRARDGSPAQHSGFVMVMTYRRLADVCAQYLRKGGAVLVEGRLQMRQWTAPDGRSGSRLEVRGEMVHFLERRPEEGTAAGVPPGEPAAARGPQSPPEDGELF